MIRLPVCALILVCLFHSPIGRACSSDDQHPKTGSNQPDFGCPAIPPGSQLEEAPPDGTMTGAADRRYNIAHVTYCFLCTPGSDTGYWTGCSLLLSCNVGKL